jgi:hypothetical protein
MTDMDRLVTENETLHALLADASAVLVHLAEAHDSEPAADCLRRIAAGRPSPASARATLRRRPRA